ncbi:hypothetical protein [uncultured Shewanella sp.]|uniref:hypothetical protein n=1 Tax=uncultured Shewanella sp. TaxID=173975 RepID=UPI00261EED79|nr:hypothetical protein [uncultured Shewanella sp.]
MKIGTIFLSALLTLLSFNSYATFKNEQLIYARLLQSPNLAEVKLGAKAMHHELPDNPELWDFMAYTLWTINANADRKHDEFDDTNAWLIKAFTEYNHSEYRHFLVQLLNQKQPKKIKRYLKKALRNIDKNTGSSFKADEYKVQTLTFVPNKLANLEKFEQINLGSTLEHVVDILGQPDGVGQYLHYKRRIFIGTQTFQNLRIMYTDLGSMELRYDENKWVLDKKSFQSTQNIANVDPQFQDLLSRLISNDAPQIKAAAREAIQLPLTQSHVLDHVAQYIWDNKNTDDRYLADSLAWLCKVLGRSQNGRYKVFMETLANSDAHKKIIKYARGPAKNLPLVDNKFTPS